MTTIIRCPAGANAGHGASPLRAREGARWWTFTCTDCGFRWQATVSQVRRLAVRRLVAEA